MSKNNKKRILVTDDAAFTRTMLKKIINKTDYGEVIGEASNGNEAIELYKKLTPDLVTMDLVMPEKGGIETIEEILKFDKGATIVVPPVASALVLGPPPTRGEASSLLPPVPPAAGGTLAVPAVSLSSSPAAPICGPSVPLAD